MQIRYIEYGKVFLQNAAGASDYSELDRSDNEIIARTKHFYLNEVATSNLANVKEENDNKVSFAFFHWDKKHYIFMQVEQRRENEFVNNGTNSYTSRPFIQARFIFVNNEYFKPNNLGIASSLVYENPNYPGRKRLPDYVYPVHGEVKDLKIEEKPVPHTSNLPEKEFLKKIINLLYNESLLSSGSTNRRLEGSVPKSIFIETDTDLEEKIRYFDQIQYWLYPAKGLISFASDYITGRHVDLILSNGSVPDNRIKKISLQNEEGLDENIYVDYFNAVSSLSEMDLYNSTLEYYLRLDIHPDIAVKLFRIIESDLKFQEEEIKGIIFANSEIITDDHFLKIFKKLLLKNDNALLFLIMNLQVPKRVILLRLLKDNKYPNLLDIHFTLAAFNNLILGSKDAAVVKSLLAKELDREKEKQVGQTIEWNVEEIQGRINRLLLAESLQEVGDEIDKTIACANIPSDEITERINAIVSEQSGCVLKFVYDISGELNIVLGKLDPAEEKSFSQQRVLEDVELLEHQTITCAKCASLRNVNIELPCSECGARKTIFGYQYGHTYRSMMRMVFVLLITLLTVILFFIMSFFGRYIFF